MMEVPDFYDLNRVAEITKAMRYEEGEEEHEQDFSRYEKTDV